MFNRAISFLGAMVNKNRVVSVLNITLNPVKMKLGYTENMKIPRAPTGLQTPGKKFWKKVMSEYEMDVSPDIQRLFLASRCLDEIAECEKIVQAEGRFVLDRCKQQKEHPASKAIRDNKVLFCRIIRELGLDLAIPEDSRPRRQY